MIISASRRTDIPAFYSRWFMERIRAGYCISANPFNPAQLRRVELNPSAVDCLVFWTRNPKPLLPYLDSLDAGGYNYYFLFTVNDYLRILEPHRPALAEIAKVFGELSERIGRERMVWRYDPIIMSNITDGRYHSAKLREIASSIGRNCSRLVVSEVQMYRKVERRLSELENSGLTLLSGEEREMELAGVYLAIKDVSQEYQIPVYSCAQSKDLSQYGIEHGACIDRELINQLFGKNLTCKKDPSQRPECGCAQSLDIGAYDTCPAGCVYCYGVNSAMRAKESCGGHDPGSETLSP
jgi:hypothetical protein